MPLTLAISPGFGATSVVAGRSTNFVVTVTNTGSASVSLTSLSINESTESDAVVAQPNFLTPNVAPGVGNPVLAAGASASYPFQCVFTTPAIAGPSPQNPGGASPGPAAATPDPFFALQAQAQSSDGSLASSTYFVPVLSTIAPFPLATGGAFQFGQGFNFINLVMLGAI